MISTTYSVQGMTCDHCVRAVTTEVSAIPGVSHVAVDLPTGAVTVTAETAVDIEAIREAVDEAGYSLGPEPR